MIRGLVTPGEKCHGPPLSPPPLPAGELPMLEPAAPPCIEPPAFAPAVPPKDCPADIAPAAAATLSEPPPVPPAFNAPLAPELIPALAPAELALGLPALGPPLLEPAAEVAGGDEELDSPHAASPKPKVNDVKKRTLEMRFFMSTSKARPRRSSQSAAGRLSLLGTDATCGPRLLPNGARRDAFLDPLLLRDRQGNNLPPASRESFQLLVASAWRSRSLA